MTFYIHSLHDVIVKKDDEVFLVIKRRIWFGVKCLFLKDDRLILKTFLFPFLLPFVMLQYQNLTKEISLYRKHGFFYSILYGDIELSLRLKILRNPCYYFFKDGVQRAALSRVKQTYSQDTIYKFETDVDDEDVNLLLIMLLYMQTRYF